MFFADRFEQLQQTQSEHTAIVFAEEKITFGELATRAWQVGNGLLERGVPRQQRVAHLAKNSPEFFEIFFGAAASGHATAGLNWRLAGPEIEQLLNYTGNQVLFVGKDFYATVEAIEANLKSVEHIIALDGGHDRWLDYKTWRDRQSNQRPQVTLHGDDDILLLYTSGTTGLPKGVQLTNQGYANAFQAFVETDILAVDNTAVFINVMPLFHVGGINLTVLPLLRGASLHLFPEFEPTRVLDTLEREKITNALFVPAMIQMLLQEPRVRERDYSQLRYMYYGASPISESVLTEAVAVFGCQFMQLYGATENYGLISKLPPAEHAPERNRLRSCGKPVVGARVKIVDALGNAVPTGEVGEILLQCDWIMKSYWNKPESTAETVVDGWYHTGDAASLDAEGYLYIKDRVKDMIITGGENVYPAEVENALHSHPEVADVAVIGVPDPKWGEAIKAVVVTTPGARVNEADIIAYARTRIAGFKVPKSIDFIAALPRNPSGKILRRELRAPYWEGRARQVS
jgi:acyl-CoA synthetase (AMP-forming)/AMP-acid ligase II